MLLKQDSGTNAIIDIQPVEPKQESELQINITENVVIDATTIVEKKKRGRKKLIKPDANSDAKESNVTDCDHVALLNADAPDKKEKKQRKVRTSKQEKENKKQQNFLHNDDDDFNGGENNTQEECSTSFLTPESASASESAPVIIHNEGENREAAKSFMKIKFKKITVRKFLILYCI